ncbi:hypothetical protein NKI20_14085 [Mesorhizobium sp. M0830]|uniref:hypothetical protein n=1 Tax=Mesorhizobium sp. M0830 TaxID=2957008 RepID=UPI00333E118D
MVDRENREDWKRERSLLALGQAVRGDEPDASLVSIGDRADPSWREDAATRHRLARSQRETPTNPKLSPATGGYQAGHESASSMNHAQTTPQAQTQPGRIRALLSWLHKAVSRKPVPEEPFDTHGWASAENAKPTQDPAYSPYSQSAPAFAPRQPVPAAYPPPFQPGGHAPFPPQMAQPPQPPQMVPPRAYSGPQLYPYAQPLAYIQQPDNPRPQSTSAPNAGQPSYPPQPAPAPPPPPFPPQQASQPRQPSVEARQAAEDVEPQAPIEEIRASLREFREAVRELTESRARRRYF